MSQEVGHITPQQFHHVLNETIVPSLGITLVRPLCEQTAQHWLLKLGWQQTRLQKGVYMDGHKHDDVKKYCQEVFLPAMAAFEQCMVHFEGANGDVWWNTEQLLNQVKQAIHIFESAHPDSIALFIFDQSSAHASLPPDALKAFKMNKSNGGKQHKQHNTVIPDTNPTVEHHISKPTLLISRADSK